MKRREQPIAKVQIQVGHVLDSAVAIRMAGPQRGEALGQPADQVVHDRQIVRGEVPDHVHIVLEQSEVDSHAVDIVDLAEIPESTISLIFRTGPL